MLVIDQPVWFDLILVLDGDNNDVRLQRAVNLLQAGYRRMVLLDERTDQVQFGRTQAETAKEYIARQHLANIEVCPGRMASTAEEAEAVAACLGSQRARRILIHLCLSHPPGSGDLPPTACRNMTGAWRQRRTLWPSNSGGAAGPGLKTWLGEMERFFWWEAVDRWRYGSIAR